MPIGQGQYAVKSQARRGSPYQHIPLGQAPPLGGCVALKATELKNGGQPLGHRDDERAQVVFVLVLAQRQAGAGGVFVDT